MEGDGLSYLFGYRWFFLKLPEEKEEKEIEEIKLALYEKIKSFHPCRVRLRWEPAVKYLVHMEIEGLTKEQVESCDKELSHLILRECDKRGVIIMATSGRAEIA